METPPAAPTTTTLTPTPHTDGGGVCVKQGAPWALSSPPGLVHTLWSRPEPGLWGLSEAAAGVRHPVELPCVLSHSMPCCRDGGGLCEQLAWAKPEGETGIKKGPAVLAKSSEIAVLRVKLHSTASGGRCQLAAAEGEAPSSSAPQPHLILP